jgi:hypothetical protein
MDIKPIANIIIGLGATSLALQSTKMLPRITRSKRKGFRIHPPSNNKTFKSSTSFLIDGALLDATEKTIK